MHALDRRRYRATGLCLSLQWLEEAPWEDGAHYVAGLHQYHGSCYPHGDSSSELPLQATKWAILQWCTEYSTCGCYEASLVHTMDALAPQEFKVSITSRW